MMPPKIKRFYKSVHTKFTGRGYGVFLDERPIRTPKKALLNLPTERLAYAVAKEWENQEETVELSTMTMTGFSNTAIDRVVPYRSEVIDELTSYAETDLLCYRAEGPTQLVERQMRDWQPHLDWLEQTYGARLRSTTGVIFIKQDPTALNVIRGLVGERDDFALTGLQALTTTIGSIVLGLATSDGVLDAKGATAAGQLDEIFQEGLWGKDLEAASRRDRIGREMASVENFLGLLLSKA